MRALGIDFGSKRIGIAVSDADGRLASAVDTVHRSGDRQRDHRRILELAAEFEVEVLVAGLPYSLDGTIGPSAAGILQEVDELAATTHLVVETYDERLTTVTAERILREQGLDAPARRKVVDKVAAAILLQAWLDGRRDTDDADPAAEPPPET